MKFSKFSKTLLIIFFPDGYKTRSCSNSCPLDRSDCMADRPTRPRHRDLAGPQHELRVFLVAPDRARRLILFKRMLPLPDPLVLTASRNAASHANRMSPECSIPRAGPPTRQGTTPATRKLLFVTIFRLRPPSPLTRAFVGLRPRNIALQRGTHPGFENWRDRGCQLAWAHSG